MNAATRRFVWLRARHRCEYCRLHQDHESFFRFHVEHVIAKQHRGSDHRNNLALACHHCNHHKSDSSSSADPLGELDVPLFHPHQDRWRDHFAWSEERPSRHSR
jgi:5-methylcytosine-specific restriction endonuclease McrA